MTPDAALEEAARMWANAKYDRMARTGFREEDRATSIESMWRQEVPDLAAAIVAYLRERAQSGRAPTDECADFLLDIAAELVPAPTEALKCEVCGAEGNLRAAVLMSRRSVVDPNVSPPVVCSGCYWAWYDGAGTTAAAIRAARGLPEPAPAGTAERDADGYPIDPPNTNPMGCT